MECITSTQNSHIKMKSIYVTLWKMQPATCSMDDVDYRLCLAPCNIPYNCKAVNSRNTCGLSKYNFVFFFHFA